MNHCLMLVLLSLSVSFNTINSQDPMTMSNDQRALQNISCNTVISCIRIIGRIIPVRIKFDVMKLYDYITGYEASKLKLHYSQLKSHLINEMQILEETTSKELKFINESIIFIRAQKKMEEDKYVLLKEILKNLN
nr:uncharacterized protein LOC121120556 [Lepeophtheirus salmonis]